MYTFSREIVIDKKTEEKKFRDHYEMRTGEKRLLSNGVVQEDVKTGHVEPGMLQDLEFAKAHMDFVKSLPDEMLSPAEMEVRVAERGVLTEALLSPEGPGNEGATGASLPPPVETPGLPTPEGLTNVPSGEGQVSGDGSNEG